MEDGASIKSKTSSKKVVFNIAIAYILVNVGDFSINVCISQLLTDLPFNLISVISLFFAMCATNYYLNKKYPLTLHILGLKKENQKKIFIFGLAGGVILLLINSPFRDGIDAIILEKHLVNPKEGVFTVACFLTIVIVLVPIVEELFFRGFIFRVVRISFSKSWGFVVSSLLFSISHSISLSAFISSLILCYVFEKTNIVGACIVAHIMWNLIWFGAKYFMVYRGLGML